MTKATFKVGTTVKVFYTTVATVVSVHGGGKKLRLYDAELNRTLWAKAKDVEAVTA